MRALAAIAKLACCLAAQATPPAPVLAQLPQARLAGGGAFTWFTLDIYDAELWVGPQGYAAAAPLAAPFVLDLRYARKLDGAKIATASIDQIDKAGTVTPAQRAAWLAAMQAIFPDVREGSHISGVYAPGAVTRFYLDGAPIGNVAEPR